MRAIEEIYQKMPERIRACLPTGPDMDNITEIRLRTGQSAQIVFYQGDRFCGDAIGQVTLKKILTALMDNSVYAWEDELACGFFTMKNGCRVGVTGRYVERNGKIAAVGEITSALIRVSRQVKGCAEAVQEYVMQGMQIKNTLVLSAPGLGKTTMLRDMARMFSEKGHSVAIADERMEIAPMMRGVCQMDVGARTDVAGGAKKADMMMHLVRAMHPDVIVTDEIGSAGDADAIENAIRCGVSVAASAHADGIAAAYRRQDVRRVLESGAFDVVVELGGAIGQIQNVLTRTRDGWQKVTK